MRVRPPDGAGVYLFLLLLPYVHRLTCREGQRTNWLLVPPLGREFERARIKLDLESCRGSSVTFEGIDSQIEL